MGMLLFQFGAPFTDLRCFNAAFLREHTDLAADLTRDIKADG
jgi:ABC-type transporter Mla maintaining outer membrane lipid asymmetry ATPase subunit MlaF